MQAAVDAARGAQTSAANVTEVTRPGETSADKASPDTTRTDTVSVEKSSADRASADWASADRASADRASADWVSAETDGENPEPVIGACQVFCVS